VDYSTNLNQAQVLKLVSPKEFDIAFFRLTEKLTHEEAYEALEQAYESLFSKRRYANFESYRIAKYKRQHAKTKS